MPAGSETFWRAYKKDASEPFAVCLWLQRQEQALIPQQQNPALGWRVGSVPGAVRGYGGKAKAISPDAIGPARFPGARLIEANRHHPRGISVGRSPFY
jgi:hypothetical protein